VDIGENRSKAGFSVATRRGFGLLRDSPSAFLGCLDVLDGSRLGGSLLARALDSLFPADQIAGRSRASRPRRATVARDLRRDRGVRQRQAAPAGNGPVGTGAFAALEAWQRA